MSAHQGKEDIGLMTGTNIAPDGSRTLLHNRITVGGQVQKDSLGDVCALVWCYPFIVQVRTTVALRIFNERTVDGTDNQVFNCGRRYLTPNLWLTNSTAIGKITTGRPRRKPSVRRIRAAIIQDHAEAEMTRSGNSRHSYELLIKPWYAAWPGPPCDQAASFQRRYRDARLDGGREHLHTEREDKMPESAYKVIELIGTSNESWV